MRVAAAVLAILSPGVAGIAKPTVSSDTLKSHEILAKDEGRQHHVLDSLPTVLEEIGDAPDLADQSKKALQPQLGGRFLMPCTSRWPHSGDHVKKIDGEADSSKDANGNAWSLAAGETATVVDVG